MCPVLHGRGAELWRGLESHASWPVAGPAARARAFHRKYWQPARGLYIMYLVMVPSMLNQVEPKVDFPGSPEKARKPWAGTPAGRPDWRVGGVPACHPPN